MRLFPLKKPTLALSLSEETLCMVNITQKWRKPILQQVKSVPLPAGVLRLSSAKPNIENTELFVDQLRTLVAPIKKPISVAISLPDLCARTSVFDFATFPTKKSEQTALLTWRFQQDLKLDTTQSRLAYGVYVPTSITDSPAPDNPEKVKVLGTAIRNEIIEQFERACLQVNLVPVSVGIAGLNIFDLYQPHIQDMLEAEDHRSTSSSSGAMFLFVSHWGFTFLGFHEGCPRFIRTKSIAIKPDPSCQQGETPHFKTEAGEGENNGHADASSREADSQNPLGPNTADSPYPPYTSMKVGKEILATLQYYIEMFPLNETTPLPSNLFVATDLEHGYTLIPPIDQIQQTLKASGREGSLIQVSHLSHTSHLDHQESRLVPDSNFWSALPGYASLKVA